jgi:hypothetical protein
MTTGSDSTERNSHGVEIHGTLYKIETYQFEGALRYDVWAGDDLITQCGSAQDGEDETALIGRIFKILETRP